MYNTIEIEGTKYNLGFFKEFSCNFPSMVGQIIKVVKKENDVVTLVRLDEIIELCREIAMVHIGDGDELGMISNKIIDSLGQPDYSKEG